MVNKEIDFNKNQDLQSNIGKSEIQHKFFQTQKITFDHNKQHGIDLSLYSSKEQQLDRRSSDSQDEFSNNPH